MTLPVAIASGAGALLGDVAQGLFGQSQASAQMAFQERMANTAYQRTVADMEKAGLNPGLMFGSGSPVGVSGGAMAPTPRFGGEVSSAISAMQAKKQMDVLDAQKDKVVQEGIGQQKTNEGIQMDNDRKADWLGLQTDGTLKGPAYLAEKRAVQAGATSAEGTAQFKSGVGEVAGDAKSLYNWLQSGAVDVMGKLQDLNNWLSTRHLLGKPAFKR